MDKGTQGVNHGGYVHSCVERLGDAIEIPADFVRVSHVACHVENSWTERIRRKDRRGDDNFQYLGRCL